MQTHLWAFTLCTQPPTLPITPQVQFYVAQLTLDLSSHNCCIQNAVGVTVACFECRPAVDVIEWYLMKTWWKNINLLHKWPHIVRVLFSCTCPWSLNSPSHLLIASYLMQTYFHSEGHLAILNHGHAMGSLLGLPLGIIALSCPWGYAHSRDRLHQMSPYKQMENVWDREWASGECLHCNIINA